MGGGSGHGGQGRVLQWPGGLGPGWAGTGTGWDMGGYLDFALTLAEQHDLRHDLRAAVGARRVARRDLGLGLQLQTAPPLFPTRVELEGCALLVVDIDNFKTLNEKSLTEEMKVKD